ncbi:MAG: protein translocase subunit SecD, partial [Saprospiraceae bacterium]
NYELYAIKKEFDGKAKLTGDVVRSARTETDPQTGEVGVNLEMEGEGPRIWGEWTKRASVNNDPIAIALDNRVISAPRVNQPILGGRSSITGQFSVPEADNFANMLEIGSLPASPKIIQTAVVGPTLGAENIQKSIISLIVGFVLVLLFMVAYYSGGGVVSILALFANILFIVAALSSLGTVLTLPGIAGIVLTIGMAVDANVIIFERIREEQRDGKSLLLAIKDGFQHSYSAIIDANITTFLTAMILFYFGLGPIKGFATVLMVGVIMSVLTAVLLGRLFIDWWTVSQKKEMSFSMGWSKGIFSNLNIDWLGKRKIAYGISFVIIVAGIASMGIRGFDLGVDFAGGYTYTVEFAEGVSTSTDDI